MVPRFVGEELLVKTCEDRIFGGESFGEELEALARARLDHRAHEEPIDEDGVDVGKLPRPRDTPSKLGSVPIFLGRLERDASPVELVEHAAEVSKLFLREVDQRARDTRVPHAARGQGQRVARRLHLAVRVIDEHLRHLSGRRDDPAGIGGL